MRHNHSKNGLSGSLSGRWPVIVTLALIICAATAVRIRLCDLPLERDEGEYAYAGQLMLQGMPPYKLAYNMKLPGTYAAYALLMAMFGQSIRGIHIGLILVNDITIVIVYLLGRTLFGRICGVIAAATFALLSLSHSVLGFAAHATHFVALFGTAGVLVLLKGSNSRRMSSFLCSGLLLGLALLMKQTGIFLALFGSIIVLANEFRVERRFHYSSFKRFGMFCFGAVMPLALTGVLLAVSGVFGQFLFWTVSYAREYVLNPSLWYGWSALKATSYGIAAAAPGVWLLTAVATVIALRSKQKRRAAVIMACFFLACFATVIPGFYFREQYFIAVLPAAALLIGAGTQVICDEIAERGYNRVWMAVPIGLILASFAQAISRHRALFFDLPPNVASHVVYGANPFPEAAEIGRYIREHSEPNDRVAVIGSEPEIYFYSHRHSATGYIYTYGLMETHKYALTMQRQMIREIETANPKFVVFVGVSWSWLSRQNSERLILDWANTYIRANLEPVGLADIRSAQQTIYRWDSDAVGAKPESKYFLWVFRRRNVL